MAGGVPEGVQEVLGPHQSLTGAFVEAPTSLLVGGSSLNICSCLGQALLSFHRCIAFQVVVAFSAG